MNALGYYGKYGKNAADIYSKASSDPTGQILGNASQYASNPFLQGQIDSAISDVNKGFQQQRGEINAAATGSGNINSTRAGVLEANAQDDAMDRAASISSTMRGAAYDTGLGLASQEYQNRLSNMSAANGALGQYATQGYDMATNGLQIGSAGLADAGTAASQFQAQAQNEIDGQQNKANANLDLISKYMAAISGNYGGTTTQTIKTPSPGTGQILLGGTSLAGGLGWKPFS